jgi:hypothetical protein
MLPLTTLVTVGAVGIVRGVTVTVPESELSPASVTARSRIEYVVPFVSPVTLMGLDVSAGVRAVKAPPSTETL